jgi:lipoate-protein ligase A
MRGPVWRLIDSGFVPPPLSAAIDEAILEAHIDGEVPNTLHFYRRSVPTISVGYFQKIAETVDVGECRRRGVSIVRRMSGGSSIYTDQGQLIYGLVVHDADLPGTREDSFMIVCTALAQAISSFGVKAEHRPVNDVEVDGKKVSGNAQLRRRGSVLQHGTVLVDTDLGAMDAVLKVSPSNRRGVSMPSQRVTTLASLLGTAPDMDTLKSRLTAGLARAFGAEFVRGNLSEREVALVTRLVEERYGRRDWNMKF